MEKLGVQKEQLLEELQQEYETLRGQESGLVKMGTPLPTHLVTRLDAVRAQITALQSGD